MEKVKSLIASRRKVFGHLITQRILLFFFLISGLLMFLLGFILYASNSAKEFLARTITDQVSLDYGFTPTIKDWFYQQTLKYMQPVQVTLILETILLGFLFLMLARYAQKILNRNKYIITLEKEVETASFYTQT